MPDPHPRNKPSIHVIKDPGEIPFTRVLKSSSDPTGVAARCEGVDKNGLVGEEIVDLGGGITFTGHQQFKIQVGVLIG